MFRWPKDSDHINYAFYQGRYIEPPATDMPQESKLDSMMASNFSGTMHDRSAKLAVLKAVKAPPARVLDFGCSWGYAPYQLSQAGYSVTGFEISRPRADFGRKGLGVKIVDTYRELDSLPPHSFDAIYSHHVLEHLPALTGVFERFGRLLAPGGVLVVFTPNCGDGMGNLREGWKPIVGEKHPMAFDTVFFRNVLPRHGFTVKALLTAPFAEADLLSGPSARPEDGYELVVCATLGAPHGNGAQAGR